MNDEGACQALGRRTFITDDEARLQNMEARRPCPRPTTEFVGVFAGTTNRFVEVRYGHNNEALPEQYNESCPSLIKQDAASKSREIALRRDARRASPADDVACDSG